MEIFLAAITFLLSAWLVQTVENRRLLLAIRIMQVVILAALPPSLVTLWVSFVVALLMLIEGRRYRTSSRILLKDALLRHPFATLALIAGVGPQGCMMSKITQIKEQAAFFPPLAEALQFNPVGTLEKLIDETVRATGWSQLYEVFNLKGDSDVAALNNILTQILSSIVRPMQIATAATLAVLLVLLVLIPIVFNALYGLSQTFGF